MGPLTYRQYCHVLSLSGTARVRQKGRRAYVEGYLPEGAVPHVRCVWRKRSECVIYMHHWKKDWPGVCMDSELSTV